MLHQRHQPIRTLDAKYGVRHTNHDPDSRAPRYRSAPNPRHPTAHSLPPAAQPRPDPPDRNAAEKIGRELVPVATLNYSRPADTRLRREPR